MSDDRPDRQHIERRLRETEERFRVAQAASGIGWFEWDLTTDAWEWTACVSSLFGFDPTEPRVTFSSWEPAIFIDDVPKLRAAADDARHKGAFYSEFRVRHPDQSVHWIAGKGEVARDPTGPSGWLTGVFYDITDRKQLEARLLALNETLEARVAEVREEARTLEILNRTGALLASELSLERLVQMVTDAGVELSGAEFGAFFYNVVDSQGEAYLLYTLSGAPREAFSRFPNPRNTAVFAPTFEGTGVVRSDDIRVDPRYGKNAPYYGMPEGHLPVCSYLAVPVISRSGEVIGGLFFGHSQPGVFTERAEHILVGIASQAAVAIDNARLYEESQRELSARRKAEQQLQALSESLEQRIEERTREVRDVFAKLNESERQFRHLVDSVADYAIFMLDTEGIVSSWNLGAERTKGYAAEEIIGKHFSQFYTKEDRQSGVPELALGAARRTGRFEMEGWRVRKGGQRFWASVIINAVHDEHGNLLGFAKVTRDLTEKQAIEDQLRQMQKMEAIGQLTGGIAHDFNNMLTVISGNIETLQRRLERDDPGAHRLIAAALRGVERATTLTHRLLAYARRQPLDPRPIELNRLIIGMSDLLTRTLGENIKVESVLSGGLWQVSVDPNQVENAVLNLALNARDAMPGGGNLTIETANTYLDEAYARAHTEVTAGQYVMLAVSDTGVGMTSDVVEKAFEPFFTTKQIGEGTGLGLSQVYGFVKQSGGHVKIYSEPGEGTTARIYFPRANMSAATLEEPRRQARIPDLEGTETILVVEDDPDVRTYTTEILRELGYRVLEAHEGDTALTVLATEPEIKLLFTDIGLPGPFNGRQLAEEARKRRADLKILFTTGYAQNAIIHHGRLDPGVQLIVKPFSFTGLAAKIRRILSES
ncbi:MAG: PAS domain S-box protein [Stellaceae bacterium]